MTGDIRPDDATFTQIVDELRHSFFNDQIIL